MERTFHLYFFNLPRSRLTFVFNSRLFKIAKCGNSTIYNWINKFGLSKPSDNDLKLIAAMGKEKSRTAIELKLESELKSLKKELEYEKLRTLALSTLIDIAERDFIEIFASDAGILLRHGLPGSCCLFTGLLCHFSFSCFT